MCGILIRSSLRIHCPVWLVLLLLGLCVIAPSPSTSCSCGSVKDNVKSELETKLDNTDSELNAITARLLVLREKMDARTREVEETKSTVQRITWELEEVYGPPCGTRRYQCGENSPQCIANFLVCDGSPDCRNGADEQQCDIPLKVGTRFEDKVINVACPGDSPESIIGEVTAIERLPWFTTKVKVQTTFTFTKLIMNSLVSASFPATSEYRLATHDWKQYMGGLRHEHMVLIVRYHGNNRFTRTMYREANMEPCAQGIRILTS